ncbi:Peroxisomal membrane protein 13 [Ananas comosus]|uniref:Peroxin-13 n=1 Tax=Ananas comosus TaxID=4615 RepID=A0A199WAX7_ANACO|nr:Peroxisomal membrane protein 13 [Ananas comosus]
MAPPNPDSSRPGNPPRKPWERAGSSPAAVPFRPPSSGSTSEVVEASGTAKAGQRNAIEIMGLACIADMAVACMEVQVGIGEACITMGHLVLTGGGEVLMATGVHGCVNYFGDILGLIDQNTEAFHMLITALLQFLDGMSLLYGNLSRFVFGLLGIRTRHIKNSQTGTSESAASRNEHGKQCAEGPKNERKKITFGGELRRKTCSLSQQLTYCFWRRLAQKPKSNRTSGGSPMQSNTASAAAKSSSAVGFGCCKSYRAVLYYDATENYKKITRPNRKDTMAETYNNHLQVTKTDKFE